MASDERNSQRTDVGLATIGEHREFVLREPSLHPQAVDPISHSHFGGSGAAAFMAS